MAGEAGMGEGVWNQRGMGCDWGWVGDHRGVDFIGR